MRKTRPNSITSITSFGEELELNLINSLFGTTTTNCLVNTGVDGCGGIWIEYPWQLKEKPSRHSLKKALAEAERQIKEYIGYPVGVEYIQKETHLLKNLDEQVRLDYDKVINTGTQTKTRIGEGLLISRVFSDPDGWGFNTCVTYTIGDGVTDLGITTVDNLEVYQAGYELEIGNRLRPFEATLTNNNTYLNITLAVESNIKYELYSKLATKQGKIEAIDLCNPVNFPTDISVYQVSYAYPSGVLRYAKQTCNCGGTCDACQLDEIVICLKPIHPEMGIFKVVPIKNTEEDPELPPCWEETTLNSCCNVCDDDIFHIPYIDPIDATCLKNKPVEIEVNYLTGCGGKWGDTNYLDDVCITLRKAVCLLAISQMKKVCDCGCVEELFRFNQEDLTLLENKLRVLNVRQSDFIFGSKRGALTAKRTLNHIKKRINYTVF
jgi:hypothetical protein